MRPLYLVIKDANTKIGIERVAAALGVTTKRCYQMADNPEGSGKAATVEQLRQLTLWLSNLADPESQKLADELLCFWVPPNRMIVRKDFLEAIQRDVGRLFRGEQIEVAPSETTLLCNECRDPLQIIKRTDGSFRYVCRGCEVGGTH